jgi:hypothetical protein
MSTQIGAWQPPRVVTCGCGHEVEAHDRVALRFCAATVSGQIKRACICVPAAAAPLDRFHGQGQVQ